MRNHLILVSLTVVVVAASFADARYSGGTGEPNDPYRIATPEDLNDIGNYEEDWNKHFILVNDVNLAQYTGTQFKIIGTSWNKPFQGVFDGNDHKVWNFTWNSTNRNLIGLFGYVDYGGEVKNLGLENIDVNVINGDWVGGLAGNNDGTIINCYLTGSVLGDWAVGGLFGANYGEISFCFFSGSVSGKDGVGGLVGVNHVTETIANCYSSGSVLGNSYVGGLVGENNGSLLDCYSTGSVTGDIYVGGLVGLNGAMVLSCHSTGDISGNYDVGGLVGYNVGSVSNCYSIGNVSGDELVGGILGIHYGNASNCYSTGDVSGSYDVGGLVGINRDIISNCYSKGEVNGIEEVGGLLGDNFGSISNCYSTGNVKGGVVVGGLVGVNWEDGSVSNSFWDTDKQSHGVTDSIGESNGGIVTNVAGLHATQMQTKSTFTSAGWDFVGETVNGPNDVWRMCVDGVNYPLLSWQLVPDFVCQDGIDFFDLEFLVESWLRNCDYFNIFCNYADINYNGLVNFDDFAILTSHWLEGTMP